MSFTRTSGTPTSLPALGSYKNDSCAVECYTLMILGLAGNDQATQAARSPEGRPSITAATTFNHVTNSHSEPWSIDQLIDSKWTKLYIVAELYSRLRLTYLDKDKLLALSGIANGVSKRRTGKYIAGMFDENLLGQMLWTSPFSATRSRAWRAPSLSWASMDGEVRLNDMKYDALALANIVAIDIDPLDTENPFGALRFASLELYCRPMRIDRHAVINQTGDYIIRDWYYRIEVQEFGFGAPGWKTMWVPDDKDEAKATVGQFFIVLMEVHGIKDENSPQEAEDHRRAVSPHEFILLSSFTHFNFGGLLLESITDKPATFKRLGKLTRNKRDGLEQRSALQLVEAWTKGPDQVISLI